MLSNMLILYFLIDGIFFFLKKIELIKHDAVYHVDPGFFLHLHPPTHTHKQVLGEPFYIVQRKAAIQNSCKNK